MWYSEPADRSAFKYQYYHVFPSWKHDGRNSYNSTTKFIVKRPEEKYMYGPTYAAKCVRPEH